MPVPARSTRWTSAGRYEAIIRVNSQSGKGGVAYLMETEHSLELPRGLQVDFAQKVQAITDVRGDELTADELLAAFHEHYLAITGPYELGLYTHWSAERGSDRRAAFTVDGEPQEVDGRRQRPDRRARRRVRAALRDRDSDPQLPRARNGRRAPTQPQPPTSRPTSTATRLGCRAPPEHRHGLPARGRERSEPCTGATQSARGGLAVRLGLFDEWAFGALLNGARHRL